MRKAAEKTRKVFGMETFDHSTICRFLTKIYLAIPALVRYGAQIMSEWGALVTRATRRKRWDEEMYEKAEQLCGLIDHILRAPPAFRMLARPKILGTIFKFSRLKPALHQDPC